MYVTYVCICTEAQRLYNSNTLCGDKTQRRTHTHTCTRRSCKQIIHQTHKLMRKSLHREELQRTHCLEMPSFNLSYISSKMDPCVCQQRVLLLQQMNFILVSCVKLSVFSQKMYVFKLLSLFM